MKYKIILPLVMLFALTIAVFSCKQSEESTPFLLRPELPEVPYTYSFETPTHFGTIKVDSTTFIDILFGFNFNGNNPEITDHGATLGRVLFYDPQLSLNNSISCASCHHQDKAFTDGTAFSTGFAGKKTPRSSMAIVNAGFNNNLFWDSRVTSVRELATKPIQNHIEMGMESMERLASKLSKIDYYPALFEKAFGSNQITEDRIGNALAQFVCSITAFDSKFDRLPLNMEEQLGQSLFFSEKTNCARCHAFPNFSAPDFAGGEYGIVGGDFINNGVENLRGGANNGLEMNYTDEGINDGRFRIPSLRNIALTAPYMHDGRFKTLDEVVEHYNSGIVPHAQLDKNLRNENGSPKRMNLSISEKRALVAFMNTLTDHTTTTDPKWSNPFK